MVKLIFSFVEMRREHPHDQLNLSIFFGIYYIKKIYKILLESLASTEKSESLNVLS